MAEYDSHPQYAFELIDLINDYRASKGSQPLTIDHTLMDLSQNYTDFLKANGKFSHTADGQYPWTRIAKSGFVYEEGLSGSKIGNENLHYGYSSRDGYHDPQDALQGWINSSGHNRNMLNPEWDRVGVGYRDGLYTANFGDGPDQPTDGSPPTSPSTTPETPGPETPQPAPDPKPLEGSFGPSQAVTYAVQEGQQADYAVLTLGNVVDESGRTATIKLEARLDGNVVGTATARVPEPGAKFKYDPNAAFDEVRVKAGESDVTGVVQNVEFTLLPEPTPGPSPTPEPTATEESFGPSQAATYEVQEGRQADYATITLDEVVDENGSTARIRLEALSDGKVVGTATASVREPGGTFKYNPSAAFDEIRVKAGESDVTGVVQKIDFTLLPEPSPASGSGSGSPSTAVGEFEQRVIELTNAERVERGIVPLESNAELNEAADRHAEDMAANRYFSHTGLDGDKAWDRAAELGYSSNGFGENIARGQRTPEAVVDAWMNSAGHRANILNSKFVEIGVGYENDYWVQNFGTGDTNPDTFIA